jgi:thioester reductase-like protein
MDTFLDCAWPVNFNTSSAAFRPHVLGVANLASFAMRTTSNAPICFLSSVATVQKWSHCHSETLLVPEKPHNDARLTDTGYGLSKLAASMILERAAEKGVRSIVIRVGQMAGPVRRGTKGSWPKHEWLPSIITSSKYLGVLPDSLGSADHVDWIPVDLAADMIWEMAKSVAARPANKEYPDNNCNYLHLTNPHVTTWQESVLPSLQEHLGESVLTVPLKEWITTLKQSSNHCVDSRSALRNPAMKLMTTYESFLNDHEAGYSFPHLCTEQAQSMSSGMKQLRSVNADWVKQWLEQWAC